LFLQRYKNLLKNNNYLQIFAKFFPAAAARQAVPQPKAQPQQDSWRRIRFPRQREARMEAEAAAAACKQGG
jgi:hypothetical protein